MNISLYFPSFPNSIRNYLQPANVSELQNWEYCTKSGDFKEFGQLSVTDQKEVDWKKYFQTVMSNLLSLSREEFEQKWPYEALHWRKDWEASKIGRMGR